MATRPFARDARGVSALEVALVAPVLLIFIIGISQLGILFFANAGLRTAVAESARYATVYPRPTDAQIKAKAAQQRFGMNPANVTGPTIVHGTSDGSSYVDIEMDYVVPIDFLFFTTAPIRLSVTRRAFADPAS